jgi:adenosine deaminase
VLDCVRDASERTGLGMAVVVAANRTRHPLDARTLARLAAQYAGRGVVGFGLSNDERRGRTADFAPAFRIAERAGLLSVPHAGELAGPEHVRVALDELGARRVGHGVRSAEEPRLLERLARDGVTLEVCPVSNVRLGVFDQLAHVPLRTLRDAGVAIALGADDPLLFGSRLLGQYEAARAVHGFTDEELADLARCSVAGSRAPDDVRQRLLRGIDDWLAAG